MIAKKSISFFLGVLMMIGLFAFVGIAAQELEEELVESSQPISVERESEAIERIDQRKQDREVRLEQRRKELIISKCSAAQGKISSMQARVARANTNRLASYNGFVSKLSRLTDRMTNAGIDTTELTTILGSLDEKISALSDDSAGYELTISDLVAMDCVEDPEGFQASLETARAQGADLKNSAQALHAYLRGPVKDAFMAVKDSLASDDQDTTETDAEPSNSTDTERTEE